MRVVYLSLLIFFLASCATDSVKTSGGITVDWRQKFSEAKLKFDAADYINAGKLFGELSDNYPSQGKFRFYQAESYRRLGKFSEAKPIYNDLISKTQDGSSLNISAKESLGLLYLNEGNFIDSKKLLEGVIAADAMRWKASNGAAIIYAMEDRLKESINYFDTALQLSPDNPSIMNNKALVLAMQKKFVEAERVLSAAADKTKDQNKRQKIEMNLAMVYGVNSKPDMAKKVLAKYMDDSEAYNNLGLYQMLRNNSKQAESYFKKSLVLSKDSNNSKAAINITKLG